MEGPDARQLHVPSHSAVDSRNFPQSFTHAIIHQVVLSAYYIPGIDLDAGIKTGNKTDIVSAFMGLTSWCGWEEVEGGRENGRANDGREEERQNMSK